jgi:RND family efflux transporter MFP subunit
MAAKSFTVVCIFMLTIAPAWLPITTQAKDQPTDSSGADGLRGITVPHRTATLAAERPSPISRIAVVEGQFVATGDLLATLDDAAQRIRIDMARAEAESTLRIDLARTKQQRARNDLEHYTRLSSGNHASGRELTEAKLNAEAARLEYELAQFEHRQLEREYARQQQLLELLRVRAPFDGYIAKVHKQIGETVDELEGLITVVELDPLEVWLDCPVRWAGRVQPGDLVTVRPLDKQWAPRVGEVILTHRVADAASQTFKIKITVANNDAAWMSGLKVVVDLDAPPPQRPDATAFGR